MTETDHSEAHLRKVPTPAVRAWLRDDLHDVPASLLGAIQRLISEADELFFALHVLAGVGGAASAERHPCRPRAVRDRAVLDRAPQALAHILEIDRGRRRQNGEQLLTAVAQEHISSRSDEREKERTAS